MSCAAQLLPPAAPAPSASPGTAGAEHAWNGSTELDQLPEWHSYPSGVKKWGGGSQTRPGAFPASMDFQKL